MTTVSRAEGPTWVALILCYAAYVALTTLAAGAVWAYVLLALVLAFHSSLQHEMIHGHPTRWPLVNEALVALPLGLSYPYRRYRDLHLAHHKDARLTDPYDDPESWYVDPTAWDQMSGPMRALLVVNNCMLGRVLLGPALSIVRFVIGDARLIAEGRRNIMVAWALHLGGAAVVIWWLAQTGASPLGYALACYGGLSLINIRSFLEHRAEDRVRGRSAIVEDGGILSLLFLHNNLHAVHHAHPETSWSLLPSLYRAHRDRFLSMNGGYYFRSYLDVFRAHMVKPKEPPAHPNMRSLGR